MAKVDFPSAILNNLVSGDAVTLNSSSYIASFPDSEVEKDKIVTVTDLAIEGIKASNYILQVPLILEADILINPVKLTINYIDTQGKALAVPFDKEQMLMDDGYDVNSPFVLGYVPKVITVKGAMPSSDIVYNIVYDKQYSSSAYILPKTGSNILLIAAGILVATGLVFITLNKKFRSK